VTVRPLMTIDDPAHAAAALHPLRLELLAALDAPDSAAGLARRLGLPRQRLNYHLRQLEGAGLVEAAGERRKRGCTERLVRAVARSYLISPATLGAVAADPDTVADRASSAYLVAVAARTIRELAAVREAARAADKSVPTLTVQADVRVASPEDQRAFAADLSAAVARVVAKYHDADAPDGRPFRVVAGAYPTPPGASAAPSTEGDR